MIKNLQAPVPIRPEDDITYYLDKISYNITLASHQVYTFGLMAIF